MAVNFNLTKLAVDVDGTGDGIINNSGELVRYEFVLLNDSTAGEDFENLELSDPLLGITIDVLAERDAGNLFILGDTNANDILDDGEDWILTTEDPGDPGVIVSDLFTYEVTQADLDSNGTAEPNDVNPGVIDNEGSASGDRVLTGATFTASGTSGVEVFQEPSIDIEKHTNGEDADSPTGPNIQVGDTVTWTYFVENTGNVTLTDVVVTDDNGTPGDTGDDFNPTPIEVGGFNVGDLDTDGELDVDEIWQYEATAPAEEGQYANIADVTADDPNDDPVTDDDPSHYFGINAEIDIEKHTNGEDADTPTGPNILVGDTVTWTYFVENTGNVDLDNVVVTDDNGTPGDTGDDFNPTPIEVGGFNTGDLDTDGVLDVGEIWEYEATAPAEEGQYANIADVTADDPNDDPVTDDDPSHYFGANPEIDIEKHTNGEDADSPTGPVLQVGDTVTWTYFVENIGNVDLENVVVTDDNGTPGDTGDDFNPTPIEAGGFNVGDLDTDGVLDVGEIWEYEATGIVEAGQYTNEACAEGTDPLTETTVDDCDPSNYFGDEPNEPGTAMTPGFWKNHVEIFAQETGSDPENDLYEDVFGPGVDVEGNPGNGKGGGNFLDDDPTLLEAISARGGGEAAFLRATTAAWANASSDDLNYCFEDEASLVAYLSILETIDDDGDGCLSDSEIINVVQDVYTAGPSAELGTDNFDHDDMGSVASALDAMNNLPHIDAGDFMA